MRKEHKNHGDGVCPKTGRSVEHSARRRWRRWIVPIVGLTSLIWFLIRVIPKPLRATYPCQRVAAPLASGFVIWVAGLIGSTWAYHRARRLFGRSRYVLAGICAAMAVLAIWGAIAATRDNPAQAASNGVFVPSDPPVSPVGVPQGIHPGRVAWVHDPAATSWDGFSSFWWSSQFNDQAAIDAMLARVVNSVAGGTSISDSWDRLFRDLNRRKGKGDTGYETTEKIAVKINLNSGGASNALDASPQMVRALLDELVNHVGVPQENITLFDAQRANISAVSGYCKPAFPDVKYNQWDGWVANSIAFSSADVGGSDVRRLPRAVVEADYFVNMALLKRHSRFSANWSDGDGQTAVTLCGKNNFGTIGSPSAMHVSIRDWSRGMGSYNGIVDLIGSKYMGGNTVLYIVDGLYGGDIHNATPKRWQMAPFNNDWPSSVFASQDPIAIDSVCLDFLNAEWGLIANADNYLHEAAQADNPPSGAVYRPDGVRLASLGVHEHWNNATEKKYSRNLGTGTGIELLTPSLTSENGPVRNLTQGTRYDLISYAVQDANDGDVIVAAPGVYQETVSFSGKNVTLRSQDPNDPAVVAATIIDGAMEAVTFSGGEDANCVLAGFTITGATRGIYCRSASPRILNSRIVGNVEAGIKLWESANPTVANCIIAGNSGGGVEMWASAVGRIVAYNFATIDHCTIVGNWGAGINGGKPVVTNSIIRDNIGDGEKPQIVSDAPTVNYCNVYGGHAGTGNIDVDPGFVEPGHWMLTSRPPGFWQHGDYHLRSDSPCVDAGDPAFTMDVIGTDIDGQSRTLGGRTDIGCDEVSQPVYLTWLAHASVKIAWRDRVVYVDPRGLSITPHDATLILVTHSHGDHYSPADIARVGNAQTQFIAPPDVVQAYGSGRTIAPGQTLEAAGLRIIGVASYNLTKTNHPKSRNWVGFIVEIGGKRIYCAGDTDLTPEMKALTNIDVAFLPAGGTYTMDAVEAAEATKFIQPVLAIPYHWGTSVGTLADAERFAKLAACNVKIMTPGETLSSDDWQKDFSFLAHWKLDETEGNVAADSVGDYDGSLAGGPVWQPAGGRVGGALRLDGVDDWVGTSLVLNPAEGSFSVFAWVKGGAPGQAILSQAGGANWLMADGSAGLLMTELRQSGRNARDLVSSKVVADGEWHRAGLTWDGTNRFLYVDDTEVARDKATSLEGSTGPLSIGADSTLQPGGFWSGLVDDVQVYRRAVKPVGALPNP